MEFSQMKNEDLVMLVLGFLVCLAPLGFGLIAAFYAV
tara:strand:- start:449 stop:559 length:111 start_codon:yes stop_codon:yes gene_type:complete